MAFEKYSTAEILWMGRSHFWNEMAIAIIANIIQLNAALSALEHYWNGAILADVETAINRASNMTWKGIKPIVHLVETTYEKGIKVLPKKLKEYLPLWQRSETLPKWDITITPT